MTPFLLSQIFATLGICSDFVSWQFRTKKAILITLICSSILFGLHFYFLEQYFAAIIQIVVVLRYTCAIFTRNIAVVIFFLAIIIGIFIYVGTYGVLPFLALWGSLLGTFSSFAKNDKQMRLYGMIGTFCWLVHNAILLSPMGIIGESVMLGSNMIGYWRYYMQCKK